MESQTLAMKRNRTSSRNPKMERCRSEEHVSSSDEPDPKRHKRDNLGSTTRKRESNLKNVLVLTGHDVRKKDGKVYMPNTIEMAQLKKPERGRFKTKIKLLKTMTGKDVEAELRRQFPVLRKDGRFYCGTLVENRTRMEFHDNPPTVWDGTKINRRIRGNSALYVYFEESPESVSERPEPQTVDSLQQQLQTPMSEPMGSPPSYYSEKLKSLKRKHADPSSSLVPEVVLSTGASVKKQVLGGTCLDGNKEGEQQSPQEQLGYHRGNSTYSPASFLCNSGTFQKTQNQQIGLKQSTGEDHSKEPQVTTEDSAYETAAGNASDVDDKTKHSIGEIEEAPRDVVARIEDYLQNSKVDPSEESSLEEIDSIRIPPHDQINLSEGELNEIYQDVLGITLFEPVITKLCPKEGPTTGGTEFVICLNVKGIPENVTSLRARFDGVGFADLTTVTEGVYTGNSPASETLGKVAVTVGSLDDTWNSPDKTEFEYHPNVTQELQKLISKMPDTKRNIPLDDQTLNPSHSAGTVCSSSSFSFYAGDRSSLADENQDKSSLKALQCILFAAAATNDRKCVEIIFRTSAGEAVFQTYRNSSILPEDTARARGHQNLAEYLQNVHKRLSDEIDCNVQTVTIDWVELKLASAEENICCAVEFQPMRDLEPVSFLESDDDESSYFADDETSVCQSPSTSEFSNEDQYVESKYTDEAEMLEHLRSDDDHGDQFDELKLSSGISALDKVFDSANQVISAKGSKCKSMATSREYTKEQMNYYRICYIVTEVMAEGLRTIFKQEWDNRYKATLGEWTDKLQNGLDFESNESPRNRSRNAHLLKTMINGDRAEWDCAMLFYAILFSDCLCCLHPAVHSNVHDLRKFRNEEFAHMSRGHLSSIDYQNAILKVNTAFHALGLPILQILKVQTQTSFPTEELRNVLKKVDNLQREVIGKDTKLHEKDKELQEKGSILGKEGMEPQKEEEEPHVLKRQQRNNVFFHLNLRPIRDVVAGEFVFGEIIQWHKAVEDIPTMTIALVRWPQIGKSRQCQFIAEKFLCKSGETPSAVSFGEVPNGLHLTLTEAWPSFAQIHSTFLKCAVVNALNSKDLSPNCRILSIDMVDSTKIKLGISWQLVADDVTSLSHLRGFLRDPRKEKWVRVWLLLSTQDIASIPVVSVSIQHFLVREGMRPYKASFLLRPPTSVADDKMREAIALDNFVFHAAKVLKNKLASNVGRVDCATLKTEDILAETNSSYDKIATTAPALSVEKVMTFDRVSYHMFTFLSFCAPQPLLKGIVVHYIKRMVVYEDEETIGAKINRCPLLLFDEEESGVYLQVQEVLHYGFSSVTENFSKETLVKTAFEVVTSFSKFKELDSPVFAARIFPHLAKVITHIEHLLFKERTSKVDLIDLSIVRDHLDVLKTLGFMCLNHCKFHVAKSYFEVALKIIQKSDQCFESQKTALYCHLGLAHSQLGDLQHANDCYKHALDIRLEELRPEHIDIATSYNKLGIVHSQLGELSRAKECHDRALAIFLKKLGPQHVDVATSYYNLGVAHTRLGELNEAKECHDRALAIFLKELGPEHLDVATSYDNLGLLHRQLGKLSRATEYHKRALAIFLKERGPVHVDVAKSYENLAFVHRQLGDLKEAKYFRECALDIRQKQLGPRYLDLAKSYDNLGLVQSQLGDLKQANDCHERALDIRLKELGPQHVDVAKSYDNLGLLHSQLGKLSRPIEFHKRALAICLEKRGAEHVDVATSCDNLGFVCRQLGDLKQAKDCHS